MSFVSGGILSTATSQPGFKSIDTCGSLNQGFYLDEQVVLACLSASNLSEPTPQQQDRKSIVIVCYLLREIEHHITLFGRWLPQLDAFERTLAAFLAANMWRQFKIGQPTASRGLYYLARCKLAVVAARLASWKAGSRCVCVCMCVIWWSHQRNALMQFNTARRSEAIAVFIVLRGLNNVSLILLVKNLLSPKILRDQLDEETALSPLISDWIWWGWLNSELASIKLSQFGQRAEVGRSSLAGEWKSFRAQETDGVDKKQPSVVGTHAHNWCCFFLALSIGFSSVKSRSETQFSSLA